MIVITRLQLLRNVGQFDNVATPATLDLKRLTLIYAENGRGKTTLAAILRSLGTGEALPINERKRLGAAQPPEVRIACAGGPQPAAFVNGVWSRICPEVMVFDDVFVDRNVYSGLDVAPEHRQNLHDLILGATGVALARRVDDLASQIRTNSADLRNKASAIPVSDRHGLTVDDFCGLAARADIDAAITAAEQRLTALENADSVRSNAEFAGLSLPSVDFVGIPGLLARTVADLDRQAAEAVKAHLAALGAGAEGWIGMGMRFGGNGTMLTADVDCPFCKQTIGTSAMFAHYRAYFGQAYTQLQTDLAEAQLRIETALKGDALAGFERQVRRAEERRRFWAPLASVPEVGIDTAAVATAWQEARDAVAAALRSKRADPLSVAVLSAEARAKVQAYDAAAAHVTAASNELLAANEAVRRVKETVRAGSVTTVETELNRLRATKARHTPSNVILCTAYLNERTAKEAADADKATAQQALDTHRATVFPSWQTAINTYLSKLGAGFKIVKIEKQPTSGRPACVYCLVINGHEVPVGASSAAAGSHTFKTTLSAGDRNTLALAFFLASLDQDLGRGSRVVVLDDPMSSLDKHRRLLTIQEIRSLLPAVAQIIVMSHDEHFLFEVYRRIPLRAGEALLADTTAIWLDTAPSGSTIALWDIESERMDGHDKRHSLLTQFMGGCGVDREKVAKSIRPHIERYLRVACPGKLLSGELLGAFRNRARYAAIHRTPFMSATKLDEFDNLVELANDVLHVTESAADLPTINDTQLREYARRTLAFVSA